MMPYTEPIPHGWAMDDANVLAHRFDLPAKLEPLTAVTVGVGQKGMVFLNGEVTVLETPDTYLVTGQELHPLEEGLRLAEAMGKAILPYNGEITLFDMRQKVWPAHLMDLTPASSEHVPMHLTVTYTVDDPVKLNTCGADYKPAPGGDRQMRQDDPRIAAAFDAGISDVVQALLPWAAAFADAKEVQQQLGLQKKRLEALPLLNRHLQPLGLEVISVSFVPLNAICPYCMKPLSLTEMRQKQCRCTDEEGNRQKGCGRPLDACPECHALVRSTDATCTRCNAELLYCRTPGCKTFRKVVRGRFCPVCKGACYPPYTP